MEYRVFRYRWAIVGAFWFVMFAFGASWFALSPMLTVFETQFNVQAWESHLLISLIGMSVIFLAWPAGSLVDKNGPKSSTSIGAFFMMVGFGLRPFLLDSFPKLLLSSIIAGIGLAWILVALGPQMLRWFPKKGASLAVGIASSGLFIGFGTGSLFMPLLVPVSIQTTSDMFNGFLIFGILATVAFFIWIVVAKDHPLQPPEKRIEVEKMKFSEGVKHVFESKNAYVYPIVGFFIVGMTLVITAFLHQLYPGKEGGYIVGFLLYGCAIGAFEAPFLVKRVGLKKVTISAVVGAIIFWFMILASNSYGVSSLFIILMAFLFGICLEASWPLALYCQETEEGVSEANVGIAAGLYISMSNIGAAVLPVLFPLLFKTNLLNFIAILGGLIFCVALWTIIRRK
ncbi:MAG TPA: MFS transporter [candidate division Zixibacteria bacterium]|nr:MFS transporter [candidate division Zixibacteria bacterium]